MTTFENYIIQNYTVADLCNQRPASEGFTHFGLSRICEEAEKFGLTERDFRSIKSFRGFAQNGAQASPAMTAKNSLTHFARDVSRGTCPTTGNFGARAPVVVRR